MIVIFKHIYRWLTDKNYRWWSKYSSPRLMYMYYDRVRHIGLTNQNKNE